MNVDQQQSQKLYMEYQMLDQQIKHFEKQLQLIESQLMDMQGTILSLDEFKSAKKDSEILFQISPGIFSKAKLIDSNELMLNVGAGVAVTKDTKGAKEILSKQLKEMQQVQVHITNELRNLVMKAAQIEQELGMLKG